MMPLPQSDPDAPITPGFAVLLTAIAGFLQLFFAINFGARPATLGIGAILGYGVAFFLAVPRIPDPPALRLGFVRPPRVAWYAMVWLTASVLLISEADNLFKLLVPLPEELRASIPPPPSDPAYRASLALILIVLYPVVEETFFRGLLQPSFVEQFGARRGILLTSLWSTLPAMLLNPWAFASAFSMAIVLGVLRHCAHSLWPALGLHGLFGLVTWLAIDETFHIPGFDEMNAAHTPLAWLLPAAILSAIGFRLCRRAAACPPAEPSPPIEPSPPTEP